MSNLCPELLNECETCIHKEVPTFDPPCDTCTGSEDNNYYIPNDDAVAYIRSLLSFVQKREDHDRRSE